jgi:hypothetical protein
MYEQIHSVYFPFTAFKGTYLKKNNLYMCNWIKDPQGIIDYLRLVLQKKFFPGCLVISRMTFEFKYLGEFEFILKNNLG